MADLHVGSGQTYATVALAYAAAAEGDDIIIHATGGGATNFDEPATTIALHWLTIRVAAGDEGLITIRPDGALTQIWILEADNLLVQGLEFALGTGSLGNRYLTIPGCADGVIDGCTFNVGAGDYGIYRGYTTAAIDWTIRKCSFVCTGSGTGMLPSSGFTGLLIQDCFFSVQTGSGLSTFGAANYVAERCTFVGEGAGTGIQQARYCTIKNCVFCDLADGIFADRLIYYLDNCTFYNCGRGIAFDANDYAHYGMDNNAFVSCTTGIDGGSYIGAPAPSNNLFYANGTDYINYDAVPINSQTTDPQFTNAPERDFTFPDTSPLKDTGKDLTGTVDDDILGTSRPQNLLWDIGAYEYALWWSIERTFVFNRATKTADGSRTTWASSNGPDPSMLYHPDVVDPVDYEDFVVLGASYA